MAAIACVCAGVVPGLAFGDFKQPGGGVYCAPDGLYPPTLQCWRTTTGLTLAMKPTGRASFETLRSNRNTREDSAPTLRYGRTWRYQKAFTCTMARKGLTCTNRSKHGWFMGRIEGYRLF